MYLILTFLESKDRFELSNNRVAACPLKPLGYLLINKKVSEETRAETFDSFTYRLLWLDTSCHIVD